MRVLNSGMHVFIVKITSTNAKGAGASRRPARCYSGPRRRPDAAACSRRFEEAAQPNRSPSSSCRRAGEVQPRAAMYRMLHSGCGGVHWSANKTDLRLGGVALPGEA